MRKTVTAATILIAGTFGVGYAIGQIGGVGSSLAAGSNPVHKHAAFGVRQHDAAATSTPHADGTIVSVSGDTITVQPDADPAGSIEYTKVTTINLSSATRYDTGNGTTSSTRPAFAKGQHIIAEGTLSGGGTSLDATLVSVHAGGPGFGPGGPPHAMGPHADGTITGVSGDTITVTPDTDQPGSNEYSKVTTIVLTKTTQFDAGRDAAPTTTRPAISNGQHIVAMGTLSTDGTTLTATNVHIDDGGPGGPGGPGSH